jgi:hypothetical protein
MISGPGAPSDDFLPKSPKNLNSSKSKLTLRGGRDLSVDVFDSTDFILHGVLERREIDTKLDTDRAELANRITFGSIDEGDHTEKDLAAIFSDTFFADESEPEGPLKSLLGHDHPMTENLRKGIEIEKNVNKVSISSELIEFYIGNRGLVFPIAISLKTPSLSMPSLEGAGERETSVGSLGGLSNITKKSIMDLDPLTRDRFLQKEGRCFLATEEDQPHLVLTARLRRNLGSSFQPDSIKNAIDRFGSASLAIINLGSFGSDEDPLFMTELDLKYYISFLSQYPEVEVLPDFIERLANDRAFYEWRIANPTLDTLINDLGNSSGIAGKIEVEGRQINLEGSYSYIYENSMEEILAKTGEETFDFLNSHELEEMREAMTIAKNYGANQTVVDRIKEGRVTILNSGYTFSSMGHAINIVFCGTHFAICNRGDRMSAETIKLYKYDRSRVNEAVLKFILNRGVQFIPSREQGLVDQEINIYSALPLMLNADLVEGEVEAPSLGPHRESKKQVMESKNQKSGNCTKSSLLTAFSMGVFIKNYEKHQDDPDKLEISAIRAKRLKTAMSYRMRSSFISKLKKYLVIHPEHNSKEVQDLIQIAEKKIGKSLIFRYLSGEKIKNINDIVSGFSDEIYMPLEGLNTRDLLIIMARRRQGTNFNIAAIPVDLETCRGRLKAYDLEGLLVSPKELALVSEVNKALYTLYKF